MPDVANFPLDSISRTVPQNLILLERRLIMSV